MKKIVAFVPGHISGFFRVCDGYENKLKIGSKNCGICIDKGVKTSILVEESDSRSLKIKINGVEQTARTTRFVAERVISSFDDQLSVEINHEVQAPMGAGFGMSGAGSLGASLGLVKVLGLDWGLEDVLELAHIAEINCKSGLGDVYPQLLGGFVLGKSPGVPPYGEVEKLTLNKDLKVVFGSFGKISTSDILKSEDFVEKSKKMGDKALSELGISKDLKTFMRVSKVFSTDLGIYEEDFLDILNRIDSKSKFGASIALLGSSVFAPCLKEEKDILMNQFRDYFGKENTNCCDLDFKGARILNEGY